MKCIDFDVKFAEFTSKWVKENAAKYKTPDEMEADFPQVYVKWLNTPMDWLGRVSPSDYFNQFDDAKMLVKWLRDYFKQNVSVPDLLMDRIAALGESAEAPLVTLLKKQARDEDEAKMCAVGILDQMESEAGFPVYIQWLKNSEENDDLAERAVTAMSEKAQGWADQLTEAYKDANEFGKARLLDVMAYVKNDERVYEAIRDAFISGDNYALHASYLLKYGDDRALEMLTRVIDAPDITYVEYIEIRNAIEGLGGLVEGERDFTGDKDYEALRQMK
ncbi:MAG: hypothetical protein E7334_06010 [Clostridiales bacterium]|nr:hypothetical protein [Clostridiales bacterium]